jgi:hypothetical protein
MIWKSDCITPAFTAVDRILSGRSITAGGKENMNELTTFGKSGCQFYSLNLNIAVVALHRFS